MIDFRVLVVDNDEYLLRAAEEQLGDITGVAVAVAASINDAKECIESQYFHLAIVDLKLHDNFDSGMEILQMLRERSPSCERFAMTRFVNEDPYGVMSATSAYDPLVSGMLTKQRSKSGEEFICLVKERIEQFTAEAMSIEGLDEVLNAVLNSRRLSAARRRDPESIELELRTLLQRLFGGRIPPAPKGQDAILETSFVPQGLSGSVAFSIVPVIVAEPKRYGSRCFVKVGQRDAIREEAERFEKRVQLNVPLKFRVELLGYILGDLLGVVAYSFAGGSGASIRSLDQVAAEDGAGSDSVDGIIARLFDKDSASWYLISGETASIRSFFDKELKAAFVERGAVIENACRNIARRCGADLDLKRGELLHESVRLSIPTNDLYGHGYLLARRPTCLVHGDMHGGNVLVNFGGEVYLIDFAHAGFGPQAIDAAVLHGSVRLWDSVRLREEDDLWRAMAALVQRERLIARRWLQGNPRGRERWMGWERPAVAIDSGVRKNFPEIDAGDVLWVYLLQAARLITFNLDEVSRLRILAWFTALRAALGLE